MTYYYTALQSRSHALLLERRMREAGVDCELTYMPRQILRDLCNLGVKFSEDEYRGAASILRRSGLPDYKVYREEIYPGTSKYVEVSI